MNENLLHIEKAMKHIKEFKNIEMRESIKPCPFCGSEHPDMDAFDIKRSITKQIDEDTQVIIFSCNGCGCRNSINVVEIADANEKINFAIEKWNKRARQ